VCDDFVWEIADERESEGLRKGGQIVIIRLLFVYILLESIFICLL
jgi:hypothetical protein